MSAIGHLRPHKLRRDPSPIQASNQHDFVPPRFAPLDQPSLDAVAVNGQVIDVVDGAYSSVDLALLSAPGALASPFGQIEFRYTDSTTDLARFGPVPRLVQQPHGL